MADTGCPPLIVEGDWSPAQNKTMKNKLQLYFQSKKKSGGGDCRVEAEDGAPRAEVYFISEEGESLDQDQDQGVRCWTQYRKLGCCRVKFSGENFISTVFGGRRRSNDDLVPEREEFEHTVFQLCADNKQNDFRKRISPWINKVFLILMTSKSMISVILLCVHTHCKITRRLFHATGANFIHLINKQGFNQSYAGQNAAMYGSGSYFAVDLVYSAQGYAKPNAMRHKRMYLARVLVGDFTQGRAGLITPPAKSSRNSADL